MMELFACAPLIIMTLVLGFGLLLIFNAESEKAKNKKHYKKAIKHV